MFRFCGAFPAGFILGKPKAVAQAKANLTGFISGPSKWNVSFWFPKAKQTGLSKTETHSDNHLAYPAGTASTQIGGACHGALKGQAASQKEDTKRKARNK